ncbi:hypothetical protein BOSEA31B_10422 [Hyphomicrobiales bacterium]|nr:hypothetical protein BOSEA31B_10422 [Hyphomicrobiales bacterium]CAH1702104.1 hypothetical protein BOSEA1005_21803 [Hyphomicrobiales bacterium]CAI0346260.1 hypothetical protein BO1005MUT1_490072 [Hyphomicrobiales bacterium]
MMPARRGAYSMKYKRQMSLILRRAQIRRATAGLKHGSSCREAARPQLRLVFSSGVLFESPKALTDGRAPLRLVD